MIDTTAPYATKGTPKAIYGHVTIRLKGTLYVDNKSNWTLSGDITALPDRYDFNPASHRSIVGEISTWIGRQFNGTGYEIRFVGNKQVFEFGVLPTASAGAR